MLSAWITLFFSKIALKTIPFSRVLRRVERRDLASKHPSSSITPSEIAWAIHHASHLVPGGRNCLTQAVAGKWLLARHGHPSTMRIGAAHLQSEIRAHAWVECNGAILIGNNEDFHQFVPFPDPINSLKR